MVDSEKQEIIHVNNALRVCGCPYWSFKKVRERMDNRKTKQQKQERKKKKKKETSEGQKKIMVTIQYMWVCLRQWSISSEDMG